MAIFTREELLAATRLEQREVATPRGSFIIREITKEQQRQIMDEATLPTNTATKKKGDLDQGFMEMLMFVESCVEPKLGRTDIPALRQLPLSVTQPVIQAILELNNLTEEAQQATRTTFPQNEGREGDESADGVRPSA